MDFTELQAFLNFAGSPEAALQFATVTGHFEANSAASNFQREPA